MASPVAFPAGTPILVGDVKYARRSLRTPATLTSSKPAQPGQQRPAWVAAIDAQVAEAVARVKAGAPLVTADEYGEALKAYAASRPDLSGVALVYSFHRAFPVMAKAVSESAKYAPARRHS